MGIGNALVLGSLWALIPAGIMAIMLVIRTYLEDLSIIWSFKGSKILVWDFLVIYSFPASASFITLATVF